MDDKIAEILEGHLDLARRQLDLFLRGYRVEPDSGLPTTEQDMLIRIDTLASALQRHQERKGNAPRRL
jgi:hypothetical protein